MAETVSELMPCPLCRSGNVIRRVEWASCNACGCTAPISAWNHRATDPAVPEPVYKAVERILDEKSAWIARPSPDVTKAVALAATIAAHRIIEEQSAIPADPAVAELVEALLDARTMAVAGRSFPINDPRWIKIADVLAKHLDKP